MHTDVDRDDRQRRRILPRPPLACFWRQLATGMAAAVPCLCTPASVLAGAWTPPQGDSYNKLAFNFFYADSTFGPSAPGFQYFSNVNLTYYGEYGLLDDLTLFGSLPLARIAQRQNQLTTDTWGVGDVELGTRYRLLLEPLVVSGQFIYKFPYLYDADDSLPLGNGQNDFDFRALFGKSLGRFGYAGLELGYRLRLGAPSDEFRYLVEYGIEPLDQFYLRTKLDGILGLNNGDPTRDSSGNPTLANQFDLGKVEFTAGYEVVEHWFLEFTATPNLYGSNTLRGGNLQFAVIYAN